VGASVAKDVPRKLKLADAARLNRDVWIVITLAMLMALARFSEAFLLLRANQTGWSLAWLPLIIVLLHLVYGIVAYPAGRVFDRIGPRGLLFGGMACLIGADLALAAASGPMLLLAGIVLWGVHMGLTQGVLSTLIAQTAPTHLTGTAFGVLSVGTAIAVLVGNVLAGVLWETAGATYTFVAGAALSLLACIGVVILSSRLRS
ncbi:MAG: MFS transporter, partial [Burkholderiaceae bacterium]